MELWGDRRGQPVQIGFVLLFGILVVAFAGYQGYAVPDQNAEVEFDHFRAVETQFTELHSGVVNAVDASDDRSVTIELGARYPPRLLALNPPPVTGRLATTDPRPVTVANASGERTADLCGSADATSQSLVYVPDYSEFRAAEGITYENTFVTREFREANRYGDQRLVRPSDDGHDRIDLLLLNGSVARQGERAYAVDINATDRRWHTLEDPTVTLPSRFSATQWDEEILDGVDGVDDVASAGDGLVEIAFEGTYRVSCAVVGLNGDPAFGPGVSDDGSEGGDGGGGAGEINPAGSDEIRIESEVRPNNSEPAIRLRFNNTAGATNVTEARISYYQYTRNDDQDPEAANVSRVGEPVSATLEVRGDFESFDPEIRLDGESITAVRFEFQRSGGNAKLGNDDWFILTVEFGTGEQGTYFVPVPS